MFFVYSLLITDMYAGVISGTLKKWYPVTIDFQGPSANESDNSPNPFLNYRLQVTFTGPSSQSYNVPGFFDGDGNGNGSGNIWRVRFAPDEAGLWNYTASFRTGTNISFDLSPTAGTATSFNGETGSFTVGALDSNAPGFLKWGRLEYANDHYLKFRDGPSFIKGGTDEPENFLAYNGFDNTTAGPFGIHTYAPHASDWHTGDPDWGGGLGKNIIGAINYLTSVNVNSIYVMPMNIGGDGQDVWPFCGTINRAGSSSNDDLHYDISKLTQWEIVFNHMQNKGMQLCLVLNESEGPNKQELDDTALGTERKLYYREMAARFGHQLALIWNVCEEYNGGTLVLSSDLMKTWAQYLQDVDPYDHPITVHDGDGFTPFLGDTRFSLTCFQIFDPHMSNHVETWRTRSANAGRKLPINIDEWGWGTNIDHVKVDTQDDCRKKCTWPVLLSGGNIEYLFNAPEGGSYDGLGVQDFRPFDNLWKWTWYARKFMQENLPFLQMTPADNLVSGESTDKYGANVFMKAGEVYAIYYDNASNTGSLDLSGASGTLQKRWYNPRTGLFEGTTTYVTGGGTISVGTPPSSSSEDWVVLIQKSGTTTKGWRLY
jgi:hypothetical protein